MNEPSGAKFKLINFNYLDFKKMCRGTERYYCYILLDPRTKTEKWPNGIPFYVGKGTRKRALAHFLPKELLKDIYKTRKIKNILNQNLFVNIEIRDPFVTTEKSEQNEKDFIKQIREEGIELCNLTDGGEGRSGACVSIETKRKMSEAHKKRGPNSKESYIRGLETRRANGGFCMSKEARERMSEQQSKEYVLISPEGEVMHIKGLSRFCRARGLNKSRLNQIARSKIGVEYKGDQYNNKKYVKKNLTHKGWVCFYKEDFSEDKINQKRYIIQNEKGEQLEKVQNLEEFSKRKGISCACLQRYALKQGKVYKGFKVELNPNY